MLLNHNQKTLDDVNRFVRNDQDCCVVNPCGSGKTSVMCGFIEEQPEARYVVVTKQANAAKYYKSRSDLFSQGNVHIVTYNKMYNDYKQGNLSPYEADYMLIDEAQYLAATLWEKAFIAIKNTYSPRVIGFTATPVRAGNEDVVKRHFDGNYAGGYTSKDLEAQGVFVEPEYVLSIYGLRKLAEEKAQAVIDSDMSDEKKSELLEKLHRIVEENEKEGTPEKVLENYLPKFMYKSNCNRILVYVSGISELEKKRVYIDGQLSRIFSGKKINSYEYTYRTSAKTLDEFLTEDESYIKVLYSIDRIMETVHIDDLRIAIMMRPSFSTRIITQQFGRTNSISNKNKPLIIDMVANLQNIGKDQKISLEKRMANKTHKVSYQNRINVSELARPLALIKIFDEIDKVLSVRCVYFRYKGYTDTLSNLCAIFCRDYEKAKELIRTEDIDTVMSLLPISAHQLRQSDIDDISLCSENFKLTNEQKQFANENIDMLHRFLERKEIADEDMIQEMYLNYLISNANSKNTDERWRRLQKIQNEFIRRYRLYCRHQYLREEVNRIDVNDIHSLCAYETAPEDTIFAYEENDLKASVAEILDAINERRAEVIRYRCGLKDGQIYTLKDAGDKMGISRSRAQQLEGEALRKLRIYMSRHKELSKFLIECLDKTYSEDCLAEDSKIHEIFAQNGLLEEEA